jgi:hypothetical protein
MQNSAFDVKKKYKLTIRRKGEDLTYTANNVRIIDSLITFTDKYNRQYIFPRDMLEQADEVTQ